MVCPFSLIPRSSPFLPSKKLGRIHYMNDIKWTEGRVREEVLQPQLTHYITHSLHSATDQHSRCSHGRNCSSWLITNLLSMRAYVFEYQPLPPPSSHIHLMSIHMMNAPRTPPFFTTLSLLCISVNTNRRLADHYSNKCLVLTHTPYQCNKYEITGLGENK